MLLLDHAHFMNIAYQEALKALDDGEVPVGAIIVHEGKIIGKGYNRIEALNDATAHAEILSIGAAANAQKTWRLNECTIYVTLEPCLMCLGAILQSRIDTIVFGASDSRFGAIVTHNHRDLILPAYRRFPHVIESVMIDECKSLIQTFFKGIRKKD